MKEFDMVLESVLARGDLAHLILFVWALADCARIVFLLREVSAATARFDALVRELALFNARMEIKRSTQGEPQ